LHAKTPLRAVANARHRPCYGCAFRLDPWCFDAPFGHGQKLSTSQAGTAERGRVVHLAVVQVAFDVPQSIVAFKALVMDAALVQGGAGAGEFRGMEKKNRRAKVGGGTRLPAQRCAVLRGRDSTAEISRAGWPRF
jgi:hypothetical protein